MKKALLFVIGLMLTSTLLAGPVGKEEAKAKALTFLGGKVGTAEGRAKAPLQQELSLASTGDAYHVFNIGSNGGFVIVSASDLTPDIIGYTDEGAFDANNIPDNMKAWLQGYADQIAWAEANGESAASESKVRRASAVMKTSIAPLIQTKWNQGNPYNYYCPDFFDAKKCATGCMATALAQILYYTNKMEGFPTGSIVDRAKYDCETKWTMFGNKQVAVPACPAASFEWTKMQLTYTEKEDASDDKNAQAVAQLMQYCGATIEMDYASSDYGGSSAKSNIMAEMKTYFGFDDHLKYCNRSNYMTNEWEDLIYQELAAARPILYSGSSTGGGHAFVCDGYSEDGYFHINWGWGGKGDGYYLLNVANPHETGIGAGSSDDGFTMNQTVLIGITKTGTAVEEREIRLSVGELTYKGSDATIARSTACPVKFDFTLWNKLFYTHDFEFALAVYDESGVRKAVSSVYVLDDIVPPNGKAGTRTSSFDFSDVSTFPSGTYKLKIVSRLKGTSEWLESIAADDRYIQMVADASNVTFTNVTPITSLAVSDVTPPICKKGDLTTITATITNNGSSFNDNLYLHVGGTCVAGNGISVEAGKKTIATFAFKYKGDVPAVKAMKITIDKAGSNVIWSGNIDAEAGTAGTDAPTLSFTTDINIVKDDDNIKKFVGSKAKAVVHAQNKTDDNYTGYIMLVLFKEGGGAIFESPKITVPANTTIDIPYEYDLDATAKYSVQVQYYHSGGPILGGVVESSYCPVAEAITIIAANGTETRVLAKSASYEVPATAAVVDLRDQSIITTINKELGGNPNCLYLLDESAAIPSGISNNVVKGTTATNIVLTDDYDFCPPFDFTATNISYTRTFTTGADKTTGGGWNTIVLPFDVTAVKKKGTDPIDWFHSSSDTGKNFWVFAFKSDDKTSVDFTYTDAIKAYTPYLINVPDVSWDTDVQLTGVPITFEGTGALIKADAKSATSGPHFIFSGDMQQTAVTQCYVLNTSGTVFEKTTGDVHAFQAYFYPTTRDWLGGALTIGFADNNETTNILSVESEEKTTDAAEGWYTLQGVKLEGKPTQKGIYIYNGKKVAIK